jgi:hypothetical protein
VERQWMFPGVELESGTQIAARQRETIVEIEAAIRTAIGDLDMAVFHLDLGEHGTQVPAQRDLRLALDAVHDALAALRYIGVEDDHV